MKSSDQNRNYLTAAPGPGGLQGIHLAIVADNPVETMGGVEKFSVILDSELRHRGASVTLYDRSFMPGYRRKWFDRLGLGIARRTGALGNAVGKDLRSANVDVIVQNGISGWSLRRTAKNLPRIVVHHGTYRGLAPMLLSPRDPLRTKVANRLFSSWELGAIEKWTSGRALSVAVSPSVADELRHIYRLDSTVIQNGIDLRTFSPGSRREAREALALEIPPESILVVFAGRVEYGKGSDLLRELAIRSQELLPQARFLVCTDQKLTGWPENLTFLTNLSYARMPLAFRASDIILHPSRYEGCSLSVIEAMACGLAPLLSHVGHAGSIPQAAPEILDYVLCDYSIESWWSRLARLVNDPSELSKCGTAARRYTEEHHSRKAMGDAYEKLILQLVSDAQSKRHWAARP